MILDANITTQKTANDFQMSLKFLVHCPYTTPKVVGT